MPLNKARAEQTICWIYLIVVVIGSLFVPLAAHLFVEVAVMYEEDVPRQITPEQRAARWPRVDPGPAPAVVGAEGLAARLVWARTRAGMAAKTLGKAIGCSQGAVQRWEKGLSPSVVDAEKLAQVLKVAAPWLLLGVGDVAEAEEMAHESAIDAVAASLPSLRNR